MPTTCTSVNVTHTPCSETAGDLGKRDTAIFLGVKWSQVQILSADHCQPDQSFSRLEAVFEFRKPPTFMSAGTVAHR